MIKLEKIYDKFNTESFQSVVKDLYFYALAGSASIYSVENFKAALGRLLFILGDSTYVDERFVRGACGAGFCDKSLCSHWQQKDDVCRSYHCEYFCGLNDYSDFLHKAVFCD